MKIFTKLFMSLFCYAYVNLSIAIVLKGNKFNKCFIAYFFFQMENKQTNLLAINNISSHKKLYSS